jgi:hypothetical protein
MQTLGHGKPLPKNDGKNPDLTTTGCSVLRASAHPKMHEKAFICRIMFNPECRTLNPKRFSLNSDGSALQ